MIVVLLLALAVLALVLSGWCMIAHRLGYSGVVGILMVVPLVNFFTFLFLAFSKSPNERRLHGYRRGAPCGMTSYYGDADQVQFLAEFEQH